MPDIILPARAVTRTQRGRDYYYGLVLAVTRPDTQDLDDPTWRADVENLLQQSAQELYGQRVELLRIVRLDEASDRVEVLAHHTQVLKGISSRQRGTQAGRKHRPGQPTDHGLIFVSRQRWVVPALRLELAAA